MLQNSHALSNHVTTRLKTKKESTFTLRGNIKRLMTTKMKKILSAKLAAKVSPTNQGLLGMEQCVTQVC